MTTTQLSSAGLDEGAIRRRVQHGWLTRLHRGVYLVGANPGRFTAEAAALAATGPQAVLSHASAAYVWGIRPREPGSVEVTLLSANRRSRKGVKVHRNKLEPDEVKRHEGLRVTSSERTLKDLANAKDIGRVLNEALALGRTTPPRLRSYLARSSSRRLQTALGDDPRITRSKAEEAFQRLIDAAGLPRPQTNTKVKGDEVDCLWPDLRLVVEIDGASTHDTPRAFVDDRRRDGDLHDAGYRVVRFTRWEVVHEPERVLVRLARATAARPP